jgi:hypothetical protein
MKKSEDDAILFYEKALKNFIDTPFVDSRKVEILLCDLKYRRLKRGKESEEQKEENKELKKEYRKVTNKIEESGIRAEAQFVGLANEWLERKGQEHLLEVYSALPLNDRKEKIDVEIIKEGKVFNISLKCFSSSSYSKEYNQGLVENEKIKTRGSNVVIGVVEIEDLQQAWKLLDEDYQDFSQKILLTKRMKSVLENVAKELFFKENVKPADSKKRIIKKQIVDNYSNVPNLLKWGYLEQQDSGDPEAILAGKKKLEADLKDKKILEKIRRTIQEEA